MQEYEQEVPKVSGPHLHFLDGLRAAAAILVVLYHMWKESFFAFTGSSLPVWWKATTIFSRGHYAVAVFIVLSGFCLMLPVARSGQNKIPGKLSDYVKRRAKRILPPYYAALLLSLAMLALIPSFGRDTHDIYSIYHRPDMLGAIVSHLFLFHNLREVWAFRIDNPMWSVATEWQIYFLFPLLLLPLSRKIGFVALICLTYWLGAASLWFYPCPACFWYIGLFCAGMGAASVCFSSGMSDNVKRLPWDRFCIALSIVAVLCLHSQRLNQWWPIGDWLVGCGTACFLIFCTLRLGLPGKQPLVVRLLSAKPTVFVGSFSYSIYLIHYPILIMFQRMLLHRGLTTPQDFVCLVFLGLPTTLFISYGFHLVFEKPFMKSPSRILAYPLASEPSLRSPAPLELP